MNGDRELLVETPEIADYEQIGPDEPTANDGAQANRLPQYVAALSAMLSAVATGAVLGWTSPITTTIEGGNFNNITVNSVEMGWIGSFVPIGAFIFSLLTGKICDAMGRKSTLLSLIIPFSIGWALIIYANGLTMLYVGRFVTGIAAGACSIAGPLYVNEISQKEIRGTLGSYFQIMVTVGILYAFVFGKFLSVTYFTYACAALPVVFALVFAFQPETPVYYARLQRHDDARLSLTRLRGVNYDVEPELVAMASTNQTNLELIRSVNKATARALIVTLSLMFFQQFCGINAVIFYTSDIFKASGILIEPNVASIIIGVVQVVATFASSLIVDRAGRKVLLLGSMFVIGCSTLLLGLYFTLKDREGSAGTVLTSLGFLPILSLCLYIVAFSLGIGPIPWIIPSEIFAPDVKGIATSVTGSFNWLLAFVVTKFFLDTELAVGQDSLFYAFSVISFVGAVFVCFVVPETKGKTVEELQVELY